MLVRTANTGRDMDTFSFLDFTSLQSRQNIAVKLNLDGIVCIPGTNEPPRSWSDIKKHDSSSDKALTRSHYPMVSPFDNADVFH